MSKLLKLVVDDATPNNAAAKPIVDPPRKSPPYSEKLRRGLFTIVRRVGVELPLQGEAEFAWFDSLTLEQNLEWNREFAAGILREAGLSETTRLPTGRERLRSADGLEGNAALAVEMLHLIKSVKTLRKLGRFDRALNQAMRLGSAAKMLEANLQFESMVRSEKKSLSNLKRKTQTVSVADAVKAYSEHGTQQRAAKKLGITARRLRQILNGR